MARKKKLVVLGGQTSEKRKLRRDLCARYGVTTGRQWKRLRRQIRRELKARGIEAPKTPKGTARPATTPPVEPQPARPRAARRVGMNPAVAAALLAGAAALPTRRGGK